MDQGNPSSGSPGGYRPTDSSPTSLSGSLFSMAALMRPRVPTSQPQPPQGQLPSGLGGSPQQSVISPSGGLGVSPSLLEANAAAAAAHSSLLASLNSQGKSIKDPMPYLIVKF